MATAQFSCGGKGGQPYLTAMLDEFPVTEWSADRIVATDYQNRWTQLIIHPKEKRVELLHYTAMWLKSGQTFEPVVSSYELK